jgi:Amt family ammonium transporter
MIPGLAMFYGGLVRSKNVLGTDAQLVAMGIIMFYGLSSVTACVLENIPGGLFGWNWNYFSSKELILTSWMPEFPNMSFNVPVQICNYHAGTDRRRLC